MKARLGAVLFGIGVLCLVLAAGLAFYVAPAVTKLPHDLTLCTGAQQKDCLRPAVVEAANARFVQVKGDATPPVAIRTGTLRSTTEVSPRPDLTRSLPAGLRESAVVWNVYGTVDWVESGDMIQQSVTEVAIDRVSGAAADWDGQSLQDAGPDAPSKVDFAGQLYKFPFHTEKRTYQYFDADLRTALPIDFQATEKLRGLEVYRFQQVIGERPMNAPASQVNALLSTFAPNATGGRMTYRNTRTLWVEPVSGTVVKAQEQRYRALVPDGGTPTVLLDGTFAFTDDTQANSAASAKDNRSSILLISRYLPIGLAVLGLLALLGGMLLIRSRARAGAAPGADRAPAEPDDAEPEVQAPDTVTASGGRKRPGGRP